MLQKPGATSYIGCIGKDKFGEVMKSDATSSGVNVRFLYTFRLFSFCEFITLLYLWCHCLSLTLYILFNQVHYFEHESVPTGTCGVCIVGGERSVSTFGYQLILCDFGQFLFFPNY